MKHINADNFHRKSGGLGTVLSLPGRQKDGSTSAPVPHAAGADSRQRFRSATAGSASGLSPGPPTVHTLRGATENLMLPERRSRILRRLPTPCDFSYHFLSLCRLRDSRTKITIAS